MDKRHVKINRDLNRFLKDSAKLEQELVEKGMPELAKQVRITTSTIATHVINMTGLQKQLSDFWKDKEAMVKREEI